VFIDNSKEQRIRNLRHFVATFVLPQTKPISETLSSSAHHVVGRGESGSEDRVRRSIKELFRTTQEHEPSKDRDPNDWKIKLTY
jgi:hypothetical protein